MVRFLVCRNPGSNMELRVRTQLEMWILCVPVKERDDTVPYMRQELVSLSGRLDCQPALRHVCSRAKMIRQLYLLKFLSFRVGPLFF